MSLSLKTSTETAAQILLCLFFWTIIWRRIKLNVSLIDVWLSDKEHTSALQMQ